jgi:hypothetical protein
MLSVAEPAYRRKVAGDCVLFNDDVSTYTTPSNGKTVGALERKWRRAVCGMTEVLSRHFLEEIEENPTYD